MTKYIDLPTLQHYLIYEAVCTFCAAPAELMQSGGIGWRVGSMVGPDPENPEYNVCKRCRRQCLQITKVPTFHVDQTPTGFWKIPEY